jgi:Flp pilus assembly pilin Flp
MRKWLARKLNIRPGRGQTTVEYAIIVSLIALASFSVILIFGDQIRALFAGGAERLATDETVEVQDMSADAQDEVEGSIREF